MKFNKGEWLLKDGVKITNSDQIREAKISDDGTELYLYIVPNKKDERVVGGPVLEAVVSSPLIGIIELTTVHFKGDRRKYPTFDINAQKIKLRSVESENTLSVFSGDTELRITKLPCSFKYFYKGKFLTGIATRYDTSMLSFADTPDGPFMRVKLDLDIGEKVYGLGERFTPFVKNGQVVDIWNEDGGTCSEIAYKNIPFYVTNRNYGVFVNDTGPVSYEICTENVTKVEFSVPGQKLDFMVIGGENVKEVISRYTALTGRPALPPAWSFGLWLTSSFTTSYDENTITGFIDGMSERNIPLSVFHIDCFWMKENEWCGFEWDKDVFPDPTGFLSRIKKRGVKICLWINPYIGQKSAAFTEAAEKGYLLMRPNGDVWQWDLWQAGQGVVDFTNPKAYEWFKNKLRKLVIQGADAFKTDFGERIPTDVVYFDGSDPQRMHNYYTYLYNKAVYEVLLETKGENEACLFSRSATACCQKFPVHWGGDCFSTYASMYESLRGGLSLCMSGFGFWSHDIGGFEGTAPTDVYKRWLAFGLLSTHSRLHGATTYRVPWLFGEEAVEVCRKFAKLKNSLMPYIFGNAVYTHETGIPSMRPMAMEFSDIGAEDCDRQYMLGDSLLVAPVMNSSGTADYYLPEGKWTEFFSENETAGGKWFNGKYDYFSLPLYVKENTILPVSSEETKTVYDYSSGLTLKIYALSSEAERTVYDSKANKKLIIRAENICGNVKIEFNGEIRNITVEMVNVAEIQNLQGGCVIKNGKNLKIDVKENMITFKVV